MAERKPVTIISIDGQWYQHQDPKYGDKMRCNGTVDGGKGQVETVIEVGTNRIAQLIKPGETYQAVRFPVGDGSFGCGIMAKDNPSLKAPDDGRYSGGGGGGGKRGGSDRAIAAQVAYKGVVDLVVADKGGVSEHFALAVREHFALICELGGIEQGAAVPKSPDTPPTPKVDDDDDLPW